MNQDSTVNLEYPRKVNDKLFIEKPLPSRTEKTGQYYLGYFTKEHKIKVFVRRILLTETEKEVVRDQAARLLTGVHENIIKYFDDQENIDFRTVAYYSSDTYRVEDLYGEDADLEEIRKNIRPSLGSKDILQQATQGLVFLHTFNFVHRNIKPSNVLIAQDNRNSEKYVVKLSDFRTSKNLQKKEDQNHSINPNLIGSIWIAPYPTPAEGGIETHPSEDVFILGCFFYYVLDKKHRHPFDNEASSRNKEMNENIQNRIKNKDDIVYTSQWNHELDPESQAIALIKDMIKYDPKDRPEIKTILGRAYFLPDDFYKLYDVPKVKPGKCVIFNQEKFQNVKDHRFGSDKDKESLKAIFEEFGFDVIIHDNKTAKELEDEIKKLADKKTTNYEEYACLIVCILSHGKEGMIDGTDCDSVGNLVGLSIEDLKNKFCGYDVPSLVGKPKIWIIQACQGDQFQEDFGNKTEQEEPKKSAGNQPENKISKAMDVDLGSTDSYSTADNVNKAQSNVLLPPDISRPPISDFIDIRATIPGCFSFRNPQKGSLLIQNLCQQLRANFLYSEQSNHHLEDLLKKVQKEISKNTSWIPITEEDKSNPNINKSFEERRDSKTGQLRVCKPCKQTIEWRSTLIDFIRFEKKHNLDSSFQNTPKRVKR